MVFAVQGSKDRSEIEMTLELRTLWFDDLKKQDPQTSKNKYIVVNKVAVQSQKQPCLTLALQKFHMACSKITCFTLISHVIT